MKLAVMKLSCENDGVVGDTYSLLLHSHLSLQELRHIADCQNHVIHTSLEHIQDGWQGGEGGELHMQVRAQV